MTNGDRDGGREGPELANPSQLKETFEALSNEKRVHLLDFLTVPKYMEEIASELGITRESARRHIDKLRDADLVEQRPGRRESGPVNEYVVVPQEMFRLAEALRETGVQESGEGRHLDTAPGGSATVASREIDDPSIIIAHGWELGKRIPLGGLGRGPDERSDDWEIGRADDAAVPLGFDPYVSEKHAAIRRDEDRLALRDLSSTNGTFVNGEELHSGEEHTLASGDVIEVGRSLLVFRNLNR